jgi:hypothetical protein
VLGAPNRSLNFDSPFMHFLHIPLDSQPVTDMAGGHNKYVKEKREGDSEV